MDGENEQRVAIKCCLKAGLSATETLILLQKSYGNEALKRSNVFTRYSGFRDGRELVEGDDKIDSNWGKHCCCCWFVQKWQSNCTKNDSRIFQHPKTVVLRVLKEDLERESCVHVLFHTPWHLNEGKIELHLAETSSRWPTQTKIILTKLLGDMRPGF